MPTFYEMVLGPTLFMLCYGRGLATGKGTQVVSVRGQSRGQSCSPPWNRTTSFCVRTEVSSRGDSGDSEPWRRDEGGGVRTSSRRLVISTNPRPFPEVRTKSLTSP